MSRLGWREALVGALLSSIAWASGGQAYAGDVEDARVYDEKATAAFALSHYAAAADYFEKAFELKPDPALLYNAAQAHRLAGNKERALSLYQNYLRVYGARGKVDKQQRIETEARIAALKEAIERDRQAAAAPLPYKAAPPAEAEPASGAPTPPPPPPPAAAPPPPAAAPPPPPAAAVEASAPLPVSQPAPQKARIWPWVAGAGGVAAAVAVVLLLTVGGSQDPSATIGKANGN